MDLRRGEGIGWGLDGNEMWHLRHGEFEGEGDNSAENKRGLLVLHLKWRLTSVLQNGSVRGAMNRMEGMRGDERDDSGNDNGGMGVSTYDSR